MNSPADTPKFSTDDVADAAGVPVETLRTWIKRGDIALVGEDPDRYTPGVGGKRLFTLRRALNVALTAELARKSMSVKEASLAATSFTDIGESIGGRADDLEELRKRQRHPGELFPDDQTVLVVRFPRDGSDPISEVERKKDAVDSLFWCNGKDCSSVILVDVEDIYHRATAMLKKYRS